MAGDETQDFVEGVLAYLGETLLRVGGGTWVWDEHVTGSPHGAAAVRFDDGVDHPPVTPLVVIQAVIQEQDTGEFARVYDEVEQAATSRRSATPGWSPTRIPTPGVDPTPSPPSNFLPTWLAAREAAFPAWAAGAPRPGGWDFSAESVHDLERLVLDAVASVDEMTAEKNTALIDGAAWYLGETLRRTYGRNWRYNPGEPSFSDPLVANPYVKRPDEEGGDAVMPYTTLRFLLTRRERGLLYERLRRYGT